MDSKLLLLLVFTVVASGCADSSGQGTGVTIQSFSASDTTLNPNQEFSVEVQIVNYNQAPTTVEGSDIRLYNLGQLEKVGESKECNPESIGASRESFNPRMVCTWVLKAPGESFIEGFESKPLSFKMSMNYSSTLENQEALRIDFQDMDQITGSSEISREISNGDITARISSQTPVALGNPQNLDIEVTNSGPGSVSGNYSFSFSHEDIISECPESREPIQSTARLNCILDAGSPGSRSIFTSISYKYEKSPNLNVKVVN